MKTAALRAWERVLDRKGHSHDERRSHMPPDALDRIRNTLHLLERSQRSR